MISPIPCNTNDPPKVGLGDISTFIDCHDIGQMSRHRHCQIDVVINVAKSA